jgi:hypothetical protein
VTLPKPMTSGAKAEGRFGKQDFRYDAGKDVYVCPANETLKYYGDSSKIDLSVSRASSEESDEELAERIQRLFGHGAVKQISDRRDD